MEEYHVPVLVDEVLSALRVRPAGLYLDGTLGGGGHTERILQAGGNVAAFDKDPDAIAYATARLRKNPAFSGRYAIYRGDFKTCRTVLHAAGITAIDGAVLDLGISSHQVDESSRGFSYRFDGPLDMRMDPDATLTAADVVNGYDEARLAGLFREYGEERYAARIAKAIAVSRRVHAIETTGQLADIIRAVVPFDKSGHPAKRTFQAIRIEVNGELTGLAEAAEDIVSLLKPGGRLAVITFHSLEDRIIKQTFRRLATDCLCDKSLPVCVCGHKAEIKEAGKYKPTDAELKRNPRAASATLRVAEKLPSNQ